MAVFTDTMYILSKYRTVINMRGLEKSNTITQNQIGKVFMDQINQIHVNSNDSVKQYLLQMAKDINEALK